MSLTKGRKKRRVCTERPPRSTCSGAAGLDRFALGARRLRDPDGSIPTRRPCGDPKRPKPEHRPHEPGDPAEERDEGEHPQCPPPGEEREVPRGRLLDDEPAEGE